MSDGNNSNKRTSHPDKIEKDVKKSKVQDEDKFKQEKDKFQQEKKEFRQEKEKFQQEKDKFQREKNEFQQERSTFLQERDKIQQEKDEIQRIESIEKQKDERIQRLEETIKTLNDENAELQNYVGKATTYSLSDSDMNHSVQIVKDVGNLQRMLETYVGNLRPNVVVRFEEVNKLLKSYDCKVQVNSIEDNYDLSIVKGVIQRCALEEIFKDAKYQLSKQQWPEGKIYESTRTLLASLDELLTKREGVSEIIKAYPIKIRQQIYAFLGNLGFANIITGEDKQDRQNNFVIVNITNRLNKSISKLRRINDPERSKKHDDMATNLIREVIRIFSFRLMVQEPVVSYHWVLYDDKIDPNIMEGRWDEEEDDDDEEKVDDLRVELCSFPLLATNYNIEGQKIYTLAKVIHQVERESNEQMTESKPDQSNSKQKNKGGKKNTKKKSKK